MVMVRPRKPEAERRSRTICVRVTTEEAATIAERAGAARMTKGAYIRRKALGRPVREAAVHRLGARERVELRRIGVNLNQIARALNSGASAPAGNAGGGRAGGRARGGADDPGGAGRATDGRDREGGPRPQAAGGRGARGPEAGEAGPALLAQLGAGRDAHPAGDEPDRGREPGGAGAGGPRGTDRRARRHPAPPRRPERSGST